MEYFGFCEQGLPGETCLKIMGIGKMYIEDFADGVTREFGKIARSCDRRT